MLVRATGRYFCAGADLRGRTKAVCTGSAVREKHGLKLHGTDARCEWCG